MLTIAALVAGIGLLVGMQMLRAGLGFVYPVVRARLVRRPLAPPAGTGAIFEAAAHELEALGFTDPVWVVYRLTPRAVNPLRGQQVWRHGETGTLAWVAAPFEPDSPHQPFIYLTSRLAGGRWVATHATDTYVLADPLTLVQIVPSVPLAEVLERHLAFAGEGGEVDLEGTADGAVLEYAEPWANAARDRLVDAGTLRREGGVARPTLREAIAILRAGSRRRRAPLEAPVGVPLQATLAGGADLARNRTPSPAMQRRLFVVSAVLFVGLGAVIFGLQVSVIVLAVIVFHEAGHWLAMRVAGHRNVQITLLPLLGGVTIGYEMDPSAAKRAWVALAGPIPGIVIGWALLAVALAGDLGPELRSWTLLGAAMLLALNYLNVLPVPPLDGAHVVRALLPHRWAWVQVAALLLGVVLGVALAVVFEFWIIGALALTQLLLVSGLLANTRVVAKLAGGPGPAKPARRCRLEWVLGVIDYLEGPVARPGPRIARADVILGLLDLRPLGIWSTLR